MTIPLMIIGAWRIEMIRMYAIIIKRSILYSAYCNYQLNRSVNGTVECEHCSKGRTSHPFTGYNHIKWFKSVRGVLERGSLGWSRTAKEVSNVAVAGGAGFGLAEGDLEDRSDVVDPMFQSEGGEL
jgi:hypothetical protein